MGNLRSSRLRFGMFSPTPSVFTRAIHLPALMSIVLLIWEKINGNSEVSLKLRVGSETE